MLVQYLCSYASNSNTIINRMYALFWVFGLQITGGNFKIHFKFSWILLNFSQLILVIFNVNHFGWCITKYTPSQLSWSWPIEQPDVTANFAGKKLYCWSLVPLVFVVVYLDCIGHHIFSSYLVDFFVWKKTEKCLELPDLARKLIRKIFWNWFFYLFFVKK